MNGFMGVVGTAGRIRAVRSITRHLIVASLCGIAAPALGMSYVPLADSDLLAAADLVAVGEVRAAAPAPGEDAEATRYRVHVERVLKGTAAASIDVRVPGALDALAPNALQVPGAPRFVAGESVLLFLDRRAGGGYDLAQLVLGAFHVVAARDGEMLAARDLLGAEAVGAVATEGLRNLPRFERWLRARAAGSEVGADYWSPATAADLARPRYATSGTPPARWFEFDDARAVTFHASDIGQVGVPGGGYREFQLALAAWNDDAGSGVRYAYGGAAAAYGGLGHADGLNVILFNDPDGDLAGSYDCARGGMLAYTRWRSSGQALHDGRMFQRIIEADIVVQDGAGCALAVGGNASAAELFAHELGHSLGLAHPCGDGLLAPCMPGSAEDDALMRSLMHADGRGASLRSDDRRGVAFLYGGQTSPLPSTTPAPVAGSGLPAAAAGGGAFGSPPASLLLGIAALWRRRHIGTKAAARASNP